MAQKQLKGLIVGMHFNPPAKLVLAALAVGTSLSLVPDPNNPYDMSAIKVVLVPENIGQQAREELDRELPSMGMTWQDLAVRDEIMLGHLAKTGGKPLADAGPSAGLSGNSVFLEQIMVWPATGKLAFLGDGKPVVIVDIDDA